MYAIIWGACDGGLRRLSDWHWLGSEPAKSIGISNEWFCLEIYDPRGGNISQHSDDGLKTSHGNKPGSTSVEIFAW